MKPKSNRNVRLLSLSLCLGFCLTLVLASAGLGNMAQFAKTCAQVREDTLRLHIVAASNSVLDQTLKLRVRDAVVTTVGSLCADAPDQKTAKAVLRQNLPMLAQLARQVLARAGYPQSAQARIERSRFSISHYASATLPAGEYDALFLRLGAGKGHNWWCCLYPALCLSASGAHYKNSAEDALVHGKYEIRLAAVDWWESHRKASEAKR